MICHTLSFPIEQDPASDVFVVWLPEKGQIGVYDVESRERIAILTEADADIPVRARFGYLISGGVLLPAF